MVNESLKTTLIHNQDLIKKQVHMIFLNISMLIAINLSTLSTCRRSKINYGTIVGNQCLINNE